MEKPVTQVVTGRVRLSYANIWEARANQSGVEQFSCSIIIPKKDKATLDKIRAAIEAAKEQGKSKWGGKIPKGLKIALRDADDEENGRDDEAYKGSYFVNANSKTKPLIIDEDKNEIFDKNEVYSGCYARVSLSFFPFDSNGNRGVGCGLRAIMKVDDGEPLGGARASANEFDDDDTL